MTVGNVQFKKCKTCDFIFKKERKRKENGKAGSPAYKLKPHLAICWRRHIYICMKTGWAGKKKKLRFLLQSLNCQISLEISHSYFSRVNSFPFVTKSQPPEPPKQIFQRKQWSSGKGLGTGFPKGVVLITNGFSHLAPKCNLRLIQRQNSKVQTVCARKCFLGLPKWHYSFLDSALNYDPDIFCKEYTQTQYIKKVTPVGHPKSRVHTPWGLSYLRNRLTKGCLGGSVG